jgi:hypothetical protein
MNIFVLDLNLKKCAEYHLDKHTTKLCVEYAQLLCSAHWLNGGEAPYKLTHKNHPCSIWVRECMENYDWLCELGLELCKEYTYRYNKIHKSQLVIEWCIMNKPKLRYNGKITKFALAMPIECKVGNAVESYREYYIIHKKSFATWKNREKPLWFL